MLGKMSCRGLARQIVALRAPIRMAQADARSWSTNAISDEGYYAAPNPKAYSKFSVYKGKSALQLGFIPPNWLTSSKGNFYVDKEGAVLLSFANANASAGAPGAGGRGLGDRSFDWNNKIVFSLRPSEMGMFIAEDSKTFEMFHDPGKGSPNEGAMTKILKVSQNPDGSYFFTVTSSEKGGSGRVQVSVPVAKHEMAVIKSLIHWAIPRVLGFDVQFEQARCNVVTAEAPFEGQ